MRRLGPRMVCQLLPARGPVGNCQLPYSRKLLNYIVGVRAMVDSVPRLLVVLHLAIRPFRPDLCSLPLHSKDSAPHLFNHCSGITFLFISFADKSEEVPTVWEIFVVVVVCAALGWLIAALFDHHRHA